MKSILKISLFLLCFVILYSCSDTTAASNTKNWMKPNGKVKVLSTIAMIDDLVKQIGGDFVDEQILIKGDLDPHSYQLVKGDDEKLAFADIIFYNGLGLEHGPSLQRHLHTNKKSLPLGDLIAEQDPNLIIKINGQVDPHIWMDVSLWTKTVPFIVQALSQHDPEHAEVYRKNGEQLQKQLMETHQQIKEALHKIPPEKRYLVTSHDAFNYFARAYLAAEDEDTMEEWQKRFAAPEGLAPESQLSPTDIRNILEHLHQYHITVLFPESNVNKDSIKKIVDAGKQEGLDLRIASESLYADAMGAQGSDGDTYIKMIMHNAKTIAGYLNP